MTLASALAIATPEWYKCIVSRHAAPMLPLRSRAPEYRERAAEARMKAESLEDEAARKTMLNSAALWDRMADYEERQEAHREEDRPQA